MLNLRFRFRFGHRLRNGFGRRDWLLDRFLRFRLLLRLFRLRLRLLGACTGIGFTQRRWFILHPIKAEIDFDQRRKFVLFR